MIYLLLFFLVVCLIITIYIERDIFSPSAILCESYLLATLCAIWNIKTWNINLHDNTVGIICLGTIVFLLTSFFIRKIYKTKYKRINDINITEKTKNVIKLKKINTIILIIIQLIILCVYTIYFLKISGVTSLKSINDDMYNYRANTAFNNDDSYDMPVIISQCVKLSRAIAYILTYVGIYNFIVNKKNNVKSHDILIPIVSAMLYIPIIIMTGGRFDIIIYFISALMMYYIIDSKIFERKGVNIKQFIKILILMILIIIIFANIKELVGRKSDLNIIDYITSYFGGSIELFDLYLQEPIEKSNIIGKETFHGINKFLYNIGIIENDYSINLEFRKSNGIVIGNVYTAYRQMYQDFGIVGVVILQMLIAIIMNCYYYNIKEKRLTNKISVKVIFYCNIVYVLFFHSYYEYLLCSVISINYLIIFISLLIVKYFLEKVKF